MPALERVITTRNVTFDERTFFDPKREELERLPTEITRREADLLDEGERRRDAASILDTLLALDDPIEESITMAVDPPESTETESTPPQELGQSSRISDRGEVGARDTSKPADEPLGQAPGGLLTPEGTPAPELGEQGDRGYATPSRATGSSNNEGEHSIVVGGEPADESVAVERHLLGEPKVIPSVKRHNFGEPENAHSVERQSSEISPTQPSKPPATSKEPHHPVQQDQPQQTRSRRARREYPPTTHASKRLRQRRAQSEEQSQGTARSDVVQFVNYARGPQHTWEDFCSTFMPGQHHEQNTLRTLHSVFAATVRQSAAQRLGAAPEKPRLHRDDLVNAPNTWRELEKHPLGERFKEAAHKEVSNLISKNT